MAEGRKVLNNKIIVLVVLGLIILLPLVYSVVLWAFPSQMQCSQPFLEKPKGHKKCIKDTEYMRSNHMTLLKNIRNQVMRQGEKGQMGLKDCRQCHTNREQFCDKCHNAVNLKPDCFNCHFFEPENHE